MTHTTLFLRSVAVIVVLAGLAHLFACGTQERQAKRGESNVPVDTTDMLVAATSSIEATEVMAAGEEQKQEAAPVTYHSDTDYIIGKWRVTYDSEAFKGTIVYDLKKEGKVFHAYTFQYEDENGDSQKAEGTKALTIQEFDGYKGSGVYVFTYEGETYDVACQIDMVDENTFMLSYDYYGYSDMETWKRF
ncbi:MAG: hypothetical protein AAFU33_04175 [Bacteroidota bacterium]